VQRLVDFIRDRPNENVVGKERIDIVDVIELLNGLFQGCRKSAEARFLFQAGVDETGRREDGVAVLYPVAVVQSKHHADAGRIGWIGTLDELVEIRVHEAVQNFPRLGYQGRDLIQHRPEIRGLVPRSAHHQPTWLRDRIRLGDALHRHLDLGCVRPGIRLGAHPGRDIQAQRRTWSSTER